MAVYGDYTYGVGMPVFYYKDGKKWNTITMPEHTHCAEEPADVTWQEVDPINDVLSDGSLRYLNRGVRLNLTFNIVPATRALYVQLVSLRAWQTANPGESFIFRRYSDKEEAYNVQLTGLFADPWAHGIAVGYAVTFTIIGTDTLDAPEPDSGEVSHYVDTSVAYEATDTGVDCYAATGCPWEWGVSRDDTLPPQWITTGTSVKDSVRIGGALERGLRTTGAERCRLDLVTPDNGYIQATLLIISGIGGLFWRSNAAMGTYYSVRVDIPNQHLITYDEAGVVLNTFDSPIVLAVNTWFNLKVKFSGSVFSIYVQEVAAGDTWLFVGSSTDATVTTGYAGQFTIAGGDMLGKDHDVYSLLGVRTDYEAATADDAAHYCAAQRVTLPI